MGTERRSSHDEINMNRTVVNRSFHLINIELIKIKL